MTRTERLGIARRLVEECQTCSRLLESETDHDKRRQLLARLRTSAMDAVTIVQAAMVEAD